MFTIPIKSKSKTAIDYFKQKEYSSDKQEEYYSNGTWTGKGAEILGFANTPILEGEIEKLALGIHPKTGERIAKKSPLDVNDCYMAPVLSAVKDFSMVYFLDEKLGEEAFKKDYDKAIEKTLDFMNTFTEVRINNKNEKRKGNLIIAKFDHETSRPTKNGKSTIRPDMQKHSHLLISRLAVQDNGKCNSFYNRKIFVNQKAIGTFFRAQLANSLREHGYEIIKRTDFEEAKDTKDGNKKVYINSFSIKGISDEQRSFFSKRNADIEYLSKKYGTATATGKSFLANSCKSSKVTYNREELIKIWKEDAKDIKVDSDYLQSIKKHESEEILNHIQSDEKLFKSIVQYTTIKETTILCRLFENEQYSGIDGKALLKEWIDTGKLIKINDFQYKTTVDIRNTDRAEKHLKNRLSVNRKNVFKLIKGGKVSVNKIINRDTTKIEQEKPQNTSKSDFSFCPSPSGPVKTDSPKPAESNFTETASSFGNTIQSIGIQIGQLEARMRDPKLSEFEKVKIRIQIERLRAQIEALKVQEINRPKLR